MKISLRAYSTIAEVFVESGNAKLSEDVSTYKDGRWVIPDREIEQFITLANDLSRFNGVSDVDFVENMFNAFLDNSERTEFLERYKEVSK